MHKTRMIIYLMATILVMATDQGFGLTEFKDGGTYNISSVINDDVRVDYQSPGKATVINILPGGGTASGKDVKVYQDGILNMTGGTIGHDLQSFGRSLVNVYDGQMGWVLESYEYSRMNVYDVTTQGHLGAFGNSKLTVYGGTIGSHLLGYYQSEIDFSGGKIGGMIIAGYNASQNSKIIFNGSNFKINGQSIGYSTLTSIYHGSWEVEPARRLTGTLKNGDTINNNLYIGGNSQIIFVPEPASLVLLGLGGLLIRKKLAVSK